MTRYRDLLVALAVLLASGLASADELKVLCAGAMKVPVSQLLARRGNAEPRVDVVYGTAGAIREKLEKGETPDLVIAPGDYIQSLVVADRVSAPSRRPLGETGIGVAVRLGAPLPDISTRESFRDTLLAAGKVVTVDPTKGTSGRLLQVMFAEMGIADAMRAKTVFLDGGFVVEAVAKGEADLGLQQITEILPVKGAQYVGPLPPELQKTTRYDAGILAGTKHAREAEALLMYLASDEARVVIEAAGFKSVR